jgi:hypothetical protein
MALSSEMNAHVSAGERAKETREKPEPRRLLWRFLFSIGLIVATLGLATVVARWTERLGGTR